MTDFFSTCEDAIISMLKNDLANHAAYFGTDPVKLAKVVNKSDDTKLDEGYDYFAITYPGAFPAGFESVSQINVSWDIYIDLFVRFTTESESWANFKAYRSDVFNLFNVLLIGRTLNKTNNVKAGTPILSSEDEPSYYSLRSNPDVRAFISQRCKLSLTQIINRM